LGRLFTPEQSPVLDIEQPRHRSTQPEPFLAPLQAPLKAQPRRPLLAPERPLFRPKLIASLEHLLMCPLLAEVKSKLLAALRVQL